MFCLAASSLCSRLRRAANGRRHAVALASTKGLELSRGQMQGLEIYHLLSKTSLHHIHSSLIERQLICLHYGCGMDKLCKRLNLANRRSINQGKGA